MFTFILWRPKITCALFVSYKQSRSNLNTSTRCNVVPLGIRFGPNVVFAKIFLSGAKVPSIECLWLLEHQVLTYEGPAINWDLANLEYYSLTNNPISQNCKLLVNCIFYILLHKALAEVHHPKCPLKASQFTRDDLLSWNIKAEFSHPEVNKSMCW